MNLPKNAWNSEQPPKKNSASILIYSTARMKCMFCVYEFALFFICDWIAIIQIDMYLKIHITISEFKWFACENFHFYLNVLSLWIFMNFSNSTFRRIKFHLKFTILTIGAFVKISLSVFRLILFAFSFRISLAIDKMHMSLLLLLFFFLLETEMVRLKRREHIGYSNRFVHIFICLMLAACINVWLCSA